MNPEIPDDSSRLATRASFERWRGTIGLFLGPLLAVILLALPMPQLSAEAHRLTAILALVITFWLTEAIPIPAAALLGLCLVVAFGVANLKAVLAAFGDPVIFLFIGSFILARAMQVHGLDRRIAYSLLSHPWVSGSTYRTIGALGLTTWLLSMWLSNTACVAMLFPVAVAMARAMAELIDPQATANGNTPRLRYTTGMLLMLTYAASIGGLGTPVGTPPNLIGLGLIKEATGVHVGFLQWMMFGAPLSFALLIAAYGILMLLFRPEARRVEGQLELARKARESLGAWTAGQRNSLIAFGVAVALWVGPGVCGLILGGEHPLVKWFAERFPEGVVALLAACLLFLLPTNWGKREFTMTWQQAVRIDWGTVLLFGAGIALGKMMFDTRLAELLGKGLIEWLGVQSLPALAGAATVTGGTITEFCSNVAATNIIVPVIISMAQAIGVSGVVAGIAATLAVSTAFTLPISTAPNAIVYGSGAIRITDMLKAGILLDLVAFALMWAASVWLVPWVLSSQ